MLEAEKEGPAGGGGNENTEGGEIMRAFCFVFFILSFENLVFSLQSLLNKLWPQPQFICCNLFFTVRVSANGMIRMPTVEYVVYL